MTVNRRGGATALWLLVTGLVFLPAHHWRSQIMDLQGRLAFPSWAHPLGTDAMGRDLWARMSRAVWETTVPLGICVSLAAVLGLALGGGLAAWSERRPWHGCLWLWEQGCGAILSVPFGIAVFFLSAWRGQAGFATVAAVFAVFTALKMAQEVMSKARGHRQLGYWQAHTVIGGAVTARLWYYGFLGAWRRDLRDLYLYQLAFAWSGEAALSYLGFGVTEPQASFGNILAMHNGELWRGIAWPALVVVAYMAWLALIPLGVASLRFFSWGRIPLSLLMPYAKVEERL